MTRPRTRGDPAIKKSPRDSGIRFLRWEPLCETVIFIYIYIERVLSSLNESNKDEEKKR